MKRVWSIILFLLILAAGAGALYWFGAPQLISFAPLDAALDVPSSAPLRLDFSRLMEADSVAERLQIEPDIKGNLVWEGSSLVFTPDEPWPAGAAIQVVLERGARASRWPSSPMRQGASWTFTVGQPKLIYLYPTSVPANIYVYDLTTNTAQQLTDTLAGVLEFDASDDGTAVYYSIRNGNNGSDIYRLGLQAGNAVGEAALVVDCGQAECRAPSISPLQDWLAFERIDPLGSDEPGYPRVWYLSLPETDAIGTLAPRPLVEASIAGEALHQTILPDWSPGGLLTYYDTTSQSFTFLDLGSGARTTFSNQTGESGSWHPSGGAFVAPEIVFETTSNPTSLPGLTQFASSQLMRFNFQDGSTNNLTRQPNLEDTSPVFSPDGVLLAFSRKYLEVTHWTPGRQLWLMRFDGSGARPLTNDPNYNFYDFAWDPSGSQLAYVRFDQTAMIEAPEIWVIDPATGKATRLVVGGYAPQWIR